MSIVSTARNVATVGAGAAAAVILSAGIASAAATVHGPGTGAELSPGWLDVGKVCGKVTVEPGNHAVQGAVVTATITGTTTTGTATTNATGGYCISGAGLDDVIFNGGTVTLSIDPDPLEHPAGTFLPAHFPNGGAPLDLAWFQAHQSGLNATGANIAYK